MNKSHIVYGPQGCGKTVNGQAIMLALGLDKIVEMDEAPRQMRQVHGVLYLTNMELEDMVRKGVVKAHERRVISFETAMDLVNRK